MSITGYTEPVGNEVLLRDVQESDLPIFFEQQLDPEATQMAAFPSRDRDAFMAHWVKIMADETTTLRTIVFHGRVAGNIVSWEHSGERNVGYWLGKEYWGRGIATEAVSQLLRQVKARPLCAHVAKHNVASIRVLQKCGFAISGDARFGSADGEQGEEFLLTLGASD
jgi:RimJ/RimL family protein N-acetyltransferase